MKWSIFPDSLLSRLTTQLVFDGESTKMSWRSVIDDEMPMHAGVFRLGANSVLASALRCFCTRGSRDSSINKDVRVNINERGRGGGMGILKRNEAMS